MSTVKQDSASSESRTYVAVCNNSNFDGFYMRKFTLPETYASNPSGKTEKCDNDVAFARWYFLNRLNFLACLEIVMTWEDYTNILEQEGDRKIVVIKPFCPKCGRNDKVFNGSLSWQCTRCQTSFIPESERRHG